MGISQSLKKHFPHSKVFPVEPAESPTLSTGHKVGTHRIQGISDEFIPQILKLESLDEILSVSDGDSILMAQKLASSSGPWSWYFIWLQFSCSGDGPRSASERLGGYHSFLRR